MRCGRCGGLRLWSHFANLGSAVGAWSYDGWRCMNCGDIVDALILQKRTLQQETISVAHRVRPFGGNVVWLRSRQTASAEDEIPPRRFSRTLRESDDLPRQMAG